jgi:hypothetical protein
MMVKQKRTKRQVQRDLGLRELPSDRLMELITEAGDGESVVGPAPQPGSQSYTPADIEDLVVSGTVGDLLARMRRECGRSLRGAARLVDISAARVQQIERSENIEIATLVLLATAAGYAVNITLTPYRRGKPPISALLTGAAM